MTQTDSKQLESFYRSNLIIWLAILSGMAILGIAAFVLNQIEAFTPMPQAMLYNKVLFLIAVILAIAILYLKRTRFIPSRIVKKVEEYPEENRFSALTAILRKNYMILWILAEAIFIIGFVDFILSVLFDSFLAYAVVGIYAFALNFPRKSLLLKCIELLSEIKPQS